MIIVAGFFLTLASVPLFGGRLDLLAELRLRRVWAAVVSIGLQISVINVFSGVPESTAVIVHLVSYAAALVFVGANLHVRGMPTLVAGGLSNLAAIGANGGIMPATQSAVRAVGGDGANVAFENSQAMHGAKLAFLGDIFVWPKPLPLANVFSIGDVLLVLGAGIIVHHTCRSRLAGPTSSGRRAGELISRALLPSATMVLAVCWAGTSYAADQTGEHWRRAQAITAVGEAGSRLGTAWGALMASSPEDRPVLVAVAAVMDRSLADATARLAGAGVAEDDRIDVTAAVKDLQARVAPALTGPPGPPVMANGDAEGDGLAGATLALAQATERARTSAVDAAEAAQLAQTRRTGVLYPVVALASAVAIASAAARSAAARRAAPEPARARSDNPASAPGRPAPPLVLH